MKNPWVVAVLLLPGCGADADMAHEYVSECRGKIVRVHSSRADVSVTALWTDVQLAAGLLAEVRGIDTPTSACVLMAGTAIVVDEHTTFATHPLDLAGAGSEPCTDGPTCRGGLTSLTGVRIGAWGHALLHEFLHVWDASHLQPGTAWHAGWNANGYAALDAAFAARYSRLTDAPRR